MRGIDNKGTRRPARDGGAGNGEGEVMIMIIRYLRRLCAIWRIMKVNLLEKIKFKIMLFLMGFPEGIRGKIELDKKLNIWDKFRYWVIVNFY